jgi:hypothetical protein
MNIHFLNVFQLKPRQHMEALISLSREKWTYNRTATIALYFIGENRDIVKH